MSPRLPSWQVSPEGAEGLSRHSDFLNYIVCRGTSVMAGQMLTVAVGWSLYVRTGNAFDLGLVGLSKFLPVLLLFLVAGMAADRFDRRRIVAIASAVQAAAGGGIGFYLLTGGTDEWPVFALLILHGSAQAFLHPALQSALPRIVSRGLLPRAIATNSSVIKIGQLGGPALAGLLIAVNTDVVYTAITLVSVVAASTMMRVRTDLRAPSGQRFGFSLVLGGFSHIWSQQALLGAISIDLIAVLFGGVMGLLPVFAVDILHVGPEHLGLMRATPAVGAFVMATILARVRLTAPWGTTFFAVLVVFACSIFVFSLSTTFWISLLALAVYGASDMVSVYIRQTLVQLETPDNLRGRVNAVNSVSISASNELGDFRAGSMAAVIGAVPAVAVGAGVTLLATGIWWYIFPKLRSLDRMA